MSGGMMQRNGSRLECQNVKKLWY